MTTNEEPKKFISPKFEKSRSKFTWNGVTVDHLIQDEMDWGKLAYTLEDTISEKEKSRTAERFIKDIVRDNAELAAVRRLLERHADIIQGLQKQMATLYQLVTAQEGELAHLSMERDMLIKGQSLQQIVTDLSK